MLLRRAYPAVTNTFAVLRLFPMSDRDMDLEILPLRHRLVVLQRQLDNEKARFTPAARAFLAALPHRLSSEALRRLRLLVRPDTILRWRRNLISRRHAARSTPKRPGRPPTVRSIRAFVLCLVRENPHWRRRLPMNSIMERWVQTYRQQLLKPIPHSDLRPVPRPTPADFTQPKPSS